jgi:hypothetical protein
MRVANNFAIRISWGALNTTNAQVPPAEILISLKVIQMINIQPQPEE